jgi:hypothetical protein
MCNTVIIDGEEYDTIGEVADRLGVPVHLVEGYDFEPEEDQCLCGADIPRAAKEAGFKFKPCGVKSKYFPWSSYEITSKVKQ